MPVHTVLTQACGVRQTATYEADHVRRAKTEVYPF